MSSAGLLHGAGRGALHRGEVYSQHVGERPVDVVVFVVIGVVFWEEEKLVGLNDQQCARGKTYM